MSTSVSIVIPTLNRRPMLEHVLPALARQACQGADVEILVCDNGSTDGTAALVASLGLTAVKWLPGPDTGRAGARNRGIAAAKGGLILFTDADIVPGPRWIAEHVTAHARQPGSAVVGCEVQVDRIEEIAAVERVPARRRTLHGARPRRLSWLFFLTGNASVPRGALEKAGPFDEGFRGYGHEDLELGYRLARAGVPIRYHPDAVNYHCHPVSLEERCEKMRLAGASTVRFYRKHRDPRIALRLGLNPLSWGLHALVPEGGRVWRACRDGMEAHAWLREIALQHAYVSGIKAAWTADGGAA